MSLAIRFTFHRSLAVAAIGMTALIGVLACDPANNPQTDVISALPNETNDASALQRGRALLFDARTRYEYPQAVALLEQAVAEDSENAEARLALAYAYAKTGKYDEGALALMPVRNRRDELGAKDRMWLDALSAKMSDQPSLEIELWRDTVEAFPDDRWAWYELASANAAVGKYGAAAAAAASALAIEPEHAKWEASWIYYLHSKALFRSGQLSEAIAAGAAGRGNETTWRSTYYRMAMAQIAAGDEKVAQSFVDEYRAISNAEGRNNPSYTETNIALFYYELGDYERAVTHARNAYTLEPASYQAWTLAYALAENDEPGNAITLLEDAEQQFPDDANAIAAKAWVLFRLGRLEDALESIEDARSMTSRQNHYFDTVRDLIDSAGRQAAGSERIAAPWLG